VRAGRGPEEEGPPIVLQKDHALRNVGEGGALHGGRGMWRRGSILEKNSHTQDFERVRRRREEGNVRRENLKQEGREGIDLPDALTGRTSFGGFVLYKNGPVIEEAVMPQANYQRIWGDGKGFKDSA